VTASAETTAAGGVEAPAPATAAVWRSPALRRLFTASTTARLANESARVAMVLLVLERGWTHGAGNTARVYRVKLTDAATSCLALPSLGADAPTLAKELVIDLATLPAQGLPAAKQQQQTALLDNFEGMAVGPRLPDGRASLILISDDNGRSDQFARILVLALG